MANISRLMHTRRMASTAHDSLLRIYAAYLSERGYEVTKIPETQTKSPDLEICRNGNHYLNEFKAPEFALDPELGLYKYTTTNSKLLQFVHTAIKQFDAYDASHNLPWVVAFASTNFQLNWHSLFEAMQGGSLVEGKVIANWANTEVFRRWQEKRYVVDLYLWLQVSEAASPYQASFFTNAQTQHRTLIDSIVNDLRAQPLSNMDNSWLLV